MKNVMKIAAVIGAVVLSLAAISCASTEKETGYYVADEDAPEKSTVTTETLTEQIIVEEAAE